MAAADLKHLNFSGLGHAASGHGSVFDRQQSGHSVSGPHNHTGHLHSVGNPHHYHSNHHHNSHSTTALNHSFSQVNSTESVFHYKCVVILTSVICLLTASVLTYLIHVALELTFMKLSSVSHL